MTPSQSPTTSSPSIAPSDSPTEVPTVSPTTNSPTDTPTTSAPTPFGGYNFYDSCENMITTTGGYITFSEDFTDSGYQTGNISDGGTTDIFSNSGMTSVRNEITYDGDDYNVLQVGNDGTYVYRFGYDYSGLFVELDFTTTTSVSQQGMDVYLICINFQSVLAFDSTINFSNGRTESIDDSDFIYRRVLAIATESPIDSLERYGVSMGSVAEIEEIKIGSF